jgi:hypothetical protein
MSNRILSHKQMVMWSGTEAGWTNLQATLAWASHEALRALVGELLTELQSCVELMYHPHEPYEAEKLRHKLIERAKKAGE